MPRSPAPPSAMPAPPRTPNSSSRPKVTPIKYKAAGAEWYATRADGILSDERYKSYAEEFKEQFIGPMPVDEFLKEFVPECSEPLPATSQMHDVVVPAGRATSVRRMHLARLLRTVLIT
ncbi:hypothetical protein OF83DRAFT_1179721 [Amylostereum chailletii]|nr:hypothetical protein OF83DRAFT_1179721 [Amylostereum chailletii]